MQRSTLIVTGAAGALGAALSQAACAHGWNVVMIDRDRRRLERAFDSIDENCAGEPVLYPMDLAGVTPDQVDAMLETVTGTYGRLDAIVHCAAHCAGLTPLEHFEPAEWLVHMQVNVNAAWLLSARALHYLRAAEAGKIVFLLEDLEKVGGPLWGAYGVSKHALAALVRQLAGEARSSGVEVRGVNPGPMQSALRARVYHSEHPRHSREPAQVAALIIAYLEGQVRWPAETIDLTEQS